MATEVSTILSNCIIYIEPRGIGSTRYELHKRNIIKLGGKLYNKNENDPATHVIVDESLTAAGSNLQYPENVKCSRELKLVGTRWLSTCVKLNKCVPTTDYEHQYTSTKVTAPENCRAVNAKRHNDASSTDCSPAKQKELDQESVCSKQLPPACNLKNNHNIITELKKLADLFRSCNDKWRAVGYDKAIQCIKQYNKEIKTYEEAESIPGITQKMAEKVCEIIECGGLRKKEEISSNGKIQVLELFTRIWGVGPATAESWYIQGHRTLDDIRNNVPLTRQQNLGLKYFVDIETSIPRDEVEEIASVVSEAASKLDPKLELVICGSYRRGKLLCGDVDLLIFREEDSPLQTFYNLLSNLKGSGFLVDDLAWGEAAGNHRKYLGMCCLPGNNRKYRRIDIFTAPKTEYAPALLHYTGSGLFNRSIRQLAIKMGMSLTEHALSINVVREGGQIVSPGQIVSTPIEASIFRYLGLEYKHPEERECLILPKKEEA